MIAANAQYYTELTRSRSNRLLLSLAVSKSVAQLLLQPARRLYCVLRQLFLVYNRCFELPRDFCERQ